MDNTGSDQIVPCAGCSGSLLFTYVLQTFISQYLPFRGPQYCHNGLSSRRNIPYFSYSVSATGFFTDNTTLTSGHIEVVKMSTFDNHILRLLYLNYLPGNLTIKVPSQIVADNILFFLFYNFSEKIGLVVLCELSARQTIHIKLQALFSLKKNNNKKHAICCNCD